ncbi:hypothetical protein SVA_1291 [Sulfurifustis variabilis]|uniref:LysM domain-containing protein n=2 Tax=Sulfurifustis variabilis TaxID=1675686 RepID=A0A1B4V2V0_9GAMM|nr:hypothetical protein SVA_1291 [Sulfurifustis variabilis]
MLGALLALCPLAGHALGLGKLKVHSALHEPLNGEIEFTSITDSELKGLNATLASRADFAIAGAERLPFHANIRFEVVRRPDGRYFLELKTDQPIEEPFVHLLVQVQWAGGRLVREYTALIDPPRYLASTPSGIEVPRVAPTAPAPEVETVPPPVADAEPPLAVEPPTTEPMTEPQPVGDAPAPETSMSDDTLGPDTASAVGISPETGWPEDDAPPTVEALAPAERDMAASTLPEWANASEYTVKRGDTLWAIAERMRADQGLTLEQVMVAIFKNNKSAFFGNNLNNLRAGKILKLPERDAVEATAPAQARKEFRAQYDVWQEYKLKLAAQSGTLKVADAAPAATPVEQAAPKVEPEATPPKAPEPAEKAQPQQPDELLKIVRSTLESEKPGADQAAAQGESAVDAAKREQAALAERVTTLEESLESRQMENRELAEKVGQVRTQLKNEKRLLELENQQLAQAQAQAQAKPAEAKPAEEPKAEARPDVEPKPESAVEPKPQPAAAPKADAKPQPRAVKPRAPKKPASASPPPEDKGFFATLLDDLVNGGMLPIIGGVVVLAGGVILLMYMRRRQRSIAEFEESILASDAIAPDSSVTTGNTSGQSITTGDTSFLSDFSQGSMGHVQTDDVDPVAEAEVYLAYGRDETAEEILKEAIVKNPNRQELKLKLLEIYHQRSDVGAFETLAEELYAALGGPGGKVWEKVEEMGRRLSPNNPMFQGGAGATARRATDSPREEVGDSVAAAGMATTAFAAAATDAESATRAESSPTIDFDFDAGSPAPKQAEAEEPAFDINFDLEEAKTGTDDAGLTFAGSSPATSEDTGLEGLDLGQPAEHVIDFEQAKAEPNAEPSGGGEISFDLPGEEKTAGDDLSLDMATEETGAEGSIRFEPTPEGGEGEIQWELDSTETAAPAADVPVNGADSGGEPQWDETATKLDLARAYIDMGDGDGARSILEEVMAEGNEQQKKQAADLVSQIG